MSYDDKMIEDVWMKGRKIINTNPNMWRKDQCGAWIKRKQYGIRDSLYGWEIHHIKNVGGDGLENLIPLQWKNNVVTGEGQLKCPVTAEGSKNVEKK